MQLQFVFCINIGIIKTELYCFPLAFNALLMVHWLSVVPQIFATRKFKFPKNLWSVNIINSTTKNNYTTKAIVCLNKVSMYFANKKKLFKFLSLLTNIYREFLSFKHRKSSYKPPISAIFTIASDKSPNPNHQKK